MFPVCPIQNRSSLVQELVTTEEKASIHRIVVGGDQLTAARIRAAQKGKLNGQTPLSRLEGIISVAEDWHTKANFLGVSIINMGLSK